MSGHDHGPVNAPIPHVLPMSVYLGVFSVLIGLTVLTVATAQVDLGPFNLPLAMIIAFTKASLVAAIFMHLWFDNKQYTIVLVASLLFLSIFIVLTGADLFTRGYVDPIRQNYIQRDEIVQEYVEQNPDDPQHLLMRPGLRNAKTDADLKKSLVDPAADHSAGHDEGAGHEAKPEGGAKH